MSNLALRVVKDDEKQDLATIANEYMSIKAQIEALEVSLKPYKTQLEEAAMGADNMKIEIDGVKISLSECSRETFDLKTAKIKLGEDVTKQFTKVTSYTQLRVSKK